MSKPSPFQQYLPRLIRYWDDEAPGQLHRTVEGSMVFVDVSGFTKMSERLARHGNVGAEEVTEVIDSTFGRLLPEAYNFGANLLKFGGDALLLLFTGDGHEGRAAAGAFAMRAELREIGVFETTAGKVSLRMSVGVHSGSFDFFLVGKSHRELIVAGPAATRTVEMEGAAAPAQILMSPWTAAALPPSNVGRATGPGYLLRAEPVVEPFGFRPATSPPVDLGQFIPAALRDTLMSGAINPEHRPAAVGFLHYGGLDRLLVEEGGPGAGEVLDRLVGVVQASVDSHGVAFLATDIAPDGGKIILTAGVPDTLGNSQEQMLLAVREIVENCPPELTLQAGINWGYVFAGAVGPPYRRTYTVMGDVVNLAARLMARAPYGEIYTTQEILEGSRTTFEVTAPEPFYVKGKKLPIQAYSVGAPEGSRVQSAQTSLPLIGRDRELETMHEAWNSAMAGRGRVVEIAAETGLGKTRLLQEFLATAEPPQVVRTECRLYQSATPYFPFRALLRTTWGLESTDPEATAAALERLVGTAAPELAPWLSLIGVPLGLDIPESEEVSQLEDQFRPARTMAAVGALLEATAQEPTLLVLEDTHWMDEASAEMLAGLLLGLSRQPWMFVLSRRPGEQGFLAPDSPEVSKFTLQPLEPDQARDLILSATEDKPLLPRQVDTLAQRAAGNPLFLIELLQALQRGGDVEALPQSVEGLIAARIDRLAPPERNLLRRLAVLGAGFRVEHSPAVLPDEAGGSTGLRPQDLRRLDDFVTVDRTGWVQFRHVLIRDVAYEGLPFRLRRQLHARIGDSIHEAVGDDAAGQAELLSTHYFHARRWPESWRFSRMAGDGAKEIYANNEAATFYRRALAAARQLDDLPPSEMASVSEALGDVLELAGLFDDSVAAYRHATRLVGDNPIRRADLLLKRARARARTGAFTPAFREITLGYKTIAETATQDALRARARLTALNAQLRQLQEQPRTALRLAQEAMIEAETSGEEEALARSYQVIDAAYDMLGQPSKATYSGRALEIYERLGDISGVAIVTNNLGAHAYLEGDWDRALEFYARAQDAFRRSGNEAEAATSGANIGEVLVSQGRLEEADGILTEAVRVLRAHNLLDAAIFADIQLGRLRLVRGDEGAVKALAELRSEALEAGQIQSAIEAAIHLGLGLVDDGEWQAALDLLSETESGSGGQAELYGCSLARVRALALAGQGRTEEALAAIRAGLEQARDEGLVYDEALLMMAEAGMLADATEREKMLEEAGNLLQHLGVVRV